MFSREVALNNSIFTDVRNFDDNIVAFLRLLYTHRKYTVMFNCPPDLREFPFDMQQLKIVMQLKHKKFAT